MTGDNKSHKPEFKAEFNLNTLLNLAGFIGVIVTVVTIWNQVSFRVDTHEKALNELKTQIVTTSTSLRALQNSDIATEAKVQQVEVGLKTLVDRIDRYLSENDRSFIEVRREMSAIATQNEVLKQILTRIEAQYIIGGSAVNGRRAR